MKDGKPWTQAEFEAAEFVARAMANPDQVVCPLCLYSTPRQLMWNDEYCVACWVSTGQSQADISESEQTEMEVSDAG